MHGLAIEPRTAGIFASCWFQVKRACQVESPELKSRFFNLQPAKYTCPSRANVTYLIAVPPRCWLPVPPKFKLHIMNNTIKQLNYELEISTAHRNRERII